MSSKWENFRLILWNGLILTDYGPMVFSLALVSPFDESPIVPCALYI